MVLQFGTDGVRGEAFTELSTDDVAALGRAAASVVPGDHWIIGRDTRESGAAFEQALVAGFCAAGRTVGLAGVVPTPALAFVGAADNVPTAVVTASHNPFSDNGVKLFAAGGLKLDDDAERSIMARLVAGPVAGAGTATPVDVASRYCDHLVSLLPAGCLTGLRVVLDCANGATSTVAPEVVRRLGAEVHVINAQPDGRNINAGCGATSPGALTAAVVAGDAHLGLAFDGDGDRVIAVDHLGNPVDGDRLIALGALQLRDAGELTNDTVVVTVMSNLGFRQAMADAGIAVVETPVGDRHVLAALDAGGFAIGGEQSGHIIYRHLATTGDGLLAGLRLAWQVRTSGRSLAELAGGVMTSYPQVLVNVRIAEGLTGVVDELGAAIAAAEEALAGEGRVLVRPSGTEPLIRVMVEAATTELAASTANELAMVVRTRFG